MLRVGVHPNNLHLRILRILEPFSDHFVCVSYPEGRDTGTLIDQASIDVGGTGSTPPILDAARGLSIVYLAASAPRPTNGALLVPKGSPVTRVSELAGSRVALVDGSFHTAFLAQLAEREGLGLSDFVRLDLSPARSAEALRAGQVDAWIAMDPLLTQERRRGSLRELEACAANVPNRSVFWTLADRLDRHGSALARLVQELQQVARRVAESPDRIARALAAEDETNEADWLQIVRNRDWTIRPADPALLGEQEAEAELLRRHGALPAAPNAATLPRFTSQPA